MTAWGVFSLLILFYFTINGLLYLLGWRHLSQHYKVHGPYSARRIGLISVRLNSFVSYNNVILAAANKEGFYLKPIFLFRPFHPPLFIPWTAVRKVEKQSFIQRFVELTVYTPGGSQSILLLQRSYKKLEACRS